MVGRNNESGNQNSTLVLPFVLIVVKSLVLPLVTREIVSQVSHKSETGVVFVLRILKKVDCAVDGYIQICQFTLSSKILDLIVHCALHANRKQGYIF